MGKLKQTLKIHRRAPEICKALKAVELQFNPFDEDARSTKDFLHMLSGYKTQQANPELKINVKLLEQDDPPLLSLEYVDGRKHNIDPVGVNSFWMLQLVERRSRFLRKDNPDPFRKQ